MECSVGADWLLSEPVMSGTSDELIEYLNALPAAAKT